MPSPICWMCIVRAWLENIWRPLARPGMSSTTATPEPPHVLAVDDSIVDRAVISRLLRSSKYRVTTVDSGKRALEILSLVRNKASQLDRSILRPVRAMPLICVRSADTYMHI